MQKKIFLQDYLVMFFFFLAIAFLGEQFGLYFSMLNRLAGVFFLLLYILTNLSNSEICSVERGISFYTRLAMLMLFIITAPLPAISLGLAILLPLIIEPRTRKID